MRCPSPNAHVPCITSVARYRFPQKCFSSYRFRKSDNKQLCWYGGAAQQDRKQGEGAVEHVMGKGCGKGLQKLQIESKIAWTKWVNFKIVVIEE